MTYDFSLFVSVFQVRLCVDFLFVILYLYKAVRIMPLKAFNVPVSLFLEGEAPKCPPPTLNFLPSVRARDSWNSWDTGEWSTEPPKSVSGTGTAGPPSACSSTQLSYPPEPAAEWGNDTESARHDQSPIIRQWSSDKWWQNGPGLSLLSQCCVTWCNGHLMLSELITKNHIKKSHALTLV